MRLATFNLLHGRSPSDGEVVGGRLCEAVRTLDADVLALQEVDRDQPRSHALDLTALAAEAMGAAHHRFAAAISGTPGQVWAAARDTDQPGAAAYGIALLSRFPVADWHVVRLPPLRLRVPLRVGADGRRRTVWVHDEPRVALSAVVDAPGGRLAVTTTHLSFLPGWNGVQLARLLRATRGLPPPRVLLGDLNLSPPPLRLLPGWRPLAAAPTFPAPAPRTQIDHVLGRGRLPAVRDARAVELPLSDHRALVVELEDRAARGPSR